MDELPEPELIKGVRSLASPFDWEGIVVEGAERAEVAGKLYRCSS